MKKDTAERVRNIEVEIEDTGSVAHTEVKFLIATIRTMDKDQLALGGQLADLLEILGKEEPTPAERGLMGALAGVLREALEEVQS